MESNKKTVLIIAGLVFLAVILAVIYYSWKNKTTQQPTTILPSGTDISTAPVPISDFPYQLGKTVQQVPTLPSSQGYGLDLSSKEIQNSRQSLDKISSKLPYTKEFVTSQNINIKIILPSRELMENKWTMTAHVYGIDFEIPEDDPDYDRMRISFLEASNDIYLWLQNQGAKPENLIIKWGDKAYIQDRAEAWLQ